MSDSPMTPSRPSKALPLAIGGAALLVVAGAALLYGVSANRSAVTPRDVTRIEIGAVCDPNELTLPAGRHTFALHNAFDRSVEWEILDGVMVVAEREHMLPGFDYTVSANLTPGSYEIICGLLSHPRGKLTVTPSTAPEAAAGPDIRAFIGPLAEYKVFLVIQAERLVSETQKLADAVKRNDLAAARALYAPARLAFRRVEAVAGRWSDLHNVIDPLADYLEKRENDPAFTGFHRLEYGLFSRNATEGLSPVADRLVADVTELKARLRAVKLVPADLSEGPARLVRGLADGKIQNGESAYAHSDLADFDASLEGIAKASGLIRPLVATSSPDLAADLDTRLEAAHKMLAGFGDASYDDIDLSRRNALAAAFAELADTMDCINVRLAMK